MSYPVYIDPDWLDNELIKGDIETADFNLEDCQRSVSIRIERLCSMTDPCITASNIPVSEVDGFTTSPILIEYGILYLTYIIARALKQYKDDVYDVVMSDYIAEADKTAKFIAYELVMNVAKETVTPKSFMKIVPFNP